MKNKWTVFKENHSTAHICVMIVLVNVLFILSSSLLIAFLPENRGHSLGEILRLAFTLMVNPSGKYIYSEAPISLIITTIVVLLGMISLTGGTVGFITSLINAFLEKTANSKRSLKLSDHIVILNYNRRVPATLLDYCYDDMDSTYIVIMTTESKEAVNKKIDEMYNLMGIKKRFKNVIVRTGNPMSKLDLDRICLSEAKTILLMTPQAVEGEESVTPESRGFAVSKLFMFVTGYLKELKCARQADIIVETAGENMDTMIREYDAAHTERKVVPIEYSRMIGKVIGLTAIMPSAYTVMRQLFSFEGIEIYLKDKPDISLEDEIISSRSVLPLFDMGDKRVYAAEDEDEIGKTGSAGYTLKKKLPDKTIVPSLGFDKEEITIVGSNNKLPCILESLDCFRAKYNSTTLHVILADTRDREAELNALYADPRWKDILDPRGPVFIESLYHPMNELSGIVDSSADTVIFLSDDDIQPEHVDEKPLLYWSAIHDCANGADVIVELRDSENENIVRTRAGDQILVSDDFLGRLYAQLGKTPERMDVIMDMITSEGDTASADSDGELNDAGDLMCVRAGTFFGDGKYDLTFTSKRELVLWIYRATAGAVMPLGVVKDDIPYLFARTDSADDGLDSCVLLGMKDSERYAGPTDRITLDANDSLVFFKLS